ncbi:ABC transporter permease [Micromonospora sp. M12]
MVQLLLAVAMIIAILGVVNILVLSVLERTRELGMLRAIGMFRGQVRRMITTESVLISLFGALTGVLLGTVLGIAVVKGCAARASPHCRCRGPCWWSTSSRPWWWAGSRPSARAAAPPNSRCSTPSVTSERPP